MTNNEILLSTKALCAQFGVSKMTIHRWLNGSTSRWGDYTPPVADFPTPKKINGRHYWRKSEIDAFIAKKAA